jgi:glucose/mannose transport system substrate-binding protein
MKKWMLGAMCTLGLAAASCGGDDTKTEGEEEVGEVRIELFSWWTAPGEAEALAALIQEHRKNFPNQIIVNKAEEMNSGGIDIKMVLADRLANNDPPDVFQQNAFEVLTALANGSKQFEQLDAFFEQEGLLSTDTMAQEIRDTVTHQGHQYALPVGVHRENALFYNMKIFNEHDIAPPTTTEELLAACAKLKAAGVTPFAVSRQSWILGKLFEGLAQGAMSPQKFVDYYAGTGPTDEAALRHAVEVYAQIVMEYSNVNEIADDSFGWTQATEALSSGEVAMFLHGDWAKGYLIKLGDKPGVDFGVVGAPGAADLFVYGVDVFVVPVGAPHHDEAMDFLKTVASVSAQAAFNNNKGSTPIRLDVPDSSLDPVAKDVLEDFRNAKMRVALKGSPVLSDSLAWFAFANDEHADLYQNVDLLQQVAIENPPE